MTSALKDAQCNSEEIDYINAHATSTPIGDNIEIKAIKKVFGEHAHKIPISSTKSMLGHQLGASGSVEAIICAMVINEGIIPPTINYQTPDPECSGLDFVPNVAREKRISRRHFPIHSVSVDTMPASYWENYKITVKYPVSF